MKSMLDLTDYSTKSVEIVNQEDGVDHVVCTHALLFIEASLAAACGTVGMHEIDMEARQAPIQTLSTLALKLAHQTACNVHAHNGSAPCHCKSSAFVVLCRHHTDQQASHNWSWHVT